MARTSPIPNLIPDLRGSDERLPYHPLVLERALGDIAPIPLPEGYRFTLYDLGDGRDWSAIEESAHEVNGVREARIAWSHSFAGHERELQGRMTFLETAAGERIGTATAWHDVRPEYGAGAGWLHWVAIREEYQGRGLAKPLIAHTLRLLEDYGHDRCYIPTQTTTWLAVRIYLGFGFRPTELSLQQSPIGWRIARRLTNHPALATIEPATDAELLGDGIDGFSSYQ